MDNFFWVHKEFCKAVSDDTVIRRDLIETALSNIVETDGESHPVCVCNEGCICSACGVDNINLGNNDA
jgi:hypothetical protein